MEIHEEEIQMQVVPDQDPDTSYLEDDPERLAAYRRGDFAYVGLRARVELWLPLPSIVADNDYRVLHVVESPGVWGIEDDCEDEYLCVVFCDERGILVEMLGTLGVKVMPGAGEISAVRLPDHDCRQHVVFHADANRVYCAMCHKTLDREGRV